MYHRRPVTFCVVVGLLLIVVASYIASYFLDGIIRSRTEATMNRTLKGYHVTLVSAHLQLLDGTLSLKGLTTVQVAHPAPPVADAQLLSFQIDWRDLFFRRIVADVLLSHPRLHINQAQLATESHTKIKHEGWQDVLERVYPLKINRFTITDGDAVYIKNPTSPPLHLADINFVSDNIRNIQSADHVYPSELHTTFRVFGTGRATIDGNANYLEEPYPGGRVHYVLTNAPLSAFAPEIREVNLSLKGGRLSSSGEVEYSPTITQIQVDNATIDDVAVGYVHKPTTATAEAQRIKATGREIKEENNRQLVYLDLREFDVRRSKFSFTDETANPRYTLELDDTDLTVRNLSNHRNQGPAHLLLQGKFMNSGSTKLDGTFLPRSQGPSFAMNLASTDTNLPSLNDLLRAHGRFDVAAGQMSVYSQITVLNDQINGYVKPLFTGVEVYSYQKDKNTSVFHQAKELVIGGAVHLLKSRKTQKVATQVNLTGKLSSPNMSTWQAFVAVLQNAFIQAILPGFDHSVRPA